MPFLFLSPSVQEFNPYITGGNEEYWMNRLADLMVPYLETSGVNVTRNDPSASLDDAIALSNSGNYDFHLALHSNAAPESLSGTLRGVDIYYRTGDANGLRMANIIVENIQPIYPLPDRVRPLATSTLRELNLTRAPAVLAELGYHDNLEDAQWLENNLMPLARSLALSVTEYLGLPFLTPVPVRSAVVSTQTGNLNMRSTPSASAVILQSVPSGTSVEVLNEFDGWYVIRYNNVIGFARSEFLNIT